MRVDAAGPAGICAGARATMREQLRSCCAGLHPEDQGKDMSMQLFSARRAARTAGGPGRPIIGRSASLRSFLIECAGSLLVALSVHNFAQQARVPITGFNGIALILNRLFALPVGVLLIALNVPVALVCARMLGRGFLFRTVRCTVVSSLMIDHLAPLFPVFSGDRLLAAVCTGVIGGTGYALIYMQHSSTGGLDFIIMAIKAKHPHLALGQIVLAFAAAVLAASYLLFGDIEGVIYGLMINYISGQVMDKMLYGLNAGKLTMIVTTDGKKIADVIEETCRRGSTILDAYGGYRLEGRQIVLCACSSKQMFTLEEAVKKADPASFMVILESNEVYGDGFRRFMIAPGD